MKKILFIDDEKDFFDVMLKIFPKDQYRVIFASDGVEGIMKCRNEEFDLIITDYRMPKMDGHKFYSQVRDVIESRKKSPTPILFVSGFTDEVKALRTDWLECDFMNKPFQMPELLQKVAKLLGQPLAPVPSPSASTNEGKTDGKIILEAGQKLFSEGEPNSYMFYLVSGSLNAYKTVGGGKEILLGNIQQGELVGEVSEDEKTHTLTVVAQENSELLIIPTSKLHGIINGQSKWVKLMIENIHKRFKQALKQIA